MVCACVCVSVQKYFSEVSPRNKFKLNIKCECVFGTIKKEIKYKR